jgi:pimeloyl-ACP methyl ester carboxylesterase
MECSLAQNASAPQLYVQERGPASAPTIVFLHGGGVGGWMWQPQLDSLQDYHCLVPDLPEHGKSMAVKPLTIRGAAELIAELIRTRAHGGRAHIVGLSLGAQVGVALLGLAPGLVNYAMINSALVRPIPGASLLTPGLVGISYRMSVPPFKNNDWWIRLNMKYSAGIPGQYFPQFKEVFQNMTEDSFVHQMVENQGFRIPAGLERVTSPVLLVVGQKEYKAMHQSARDLAAAIPGARGYLVVAPAGSRLAEGHNWSMTMPDLFTKTVRAWIEGQPLPAQLQPLG